MIKLVDNDSINTPDKRAKMEDDLSMIETKGELKGTPTEALALSVDIFNDYNNAIQVVRYSSFEKNQAIDQASRMEFANWRFEMAQNVPIKNPQGLIDWVEESFDVDVEQFEQAAPGAAPQANMGGTPGGPGGGGSGKPQALAENAPSQIGANASQSM